MQKNTEKGITTERFGSHHEVIEFVAAAASESSVKKLREVCQVSHARIIQTVR